MQNSKHYFRAGLLIVGGFFVLLLLRALFLPPSFGKFGFYRGDNIAEQMAKAPRYAKADACETCHVEPVLQHKQGAHRAVPCQDCHAPLAEHIDLEKGEWIGSMPIQKNSKLCLRCHLKLPSRPATFPQIDLEDHLANVPEAHSPEVCFTCHKPHKPEKRNRRKK